VLDEDVCQWAKSNNVKLVHVKCEKPKDDGGGLSKEAAAKALMHILDSRQLPLYLHCLDGQSVSTLMVAVLRRVQAWSTRATVEEIKQSLGHDEEVIGYQTSFVEKFGKTDGVRLPPRRYIPDWTWTDPSPLRRLKDPYDVIVTKEKPGDRSAANTPANGTLNSQHKRYESNDGYFAAGSNNPSPTIIAFGVGLLPVQHPLLRVKFDLDPDLPPPPLTGALTPLHSRDNMGLFSPVTSRPSSRTGRNTSHGHALHPHHHHHNMDARGLSRSESALESPRRKVLSVEHSPSLGNSNNNSSVDGLLSPLSHHADFISSRLAHGSSSSSVDELQDQSLDESPSRRGTDVNPTLRDFHDSSTPTKSSLLLNHSTPRASSSSSPQNPHRPVSTRGAIFGLGLNSAGSEESKANNTNAEGTISFDARHHNFQAERPVALERSISELVKSPSYHSEAQLMNIHQEEEYYSDTHEDNTSSPIKKNRSQAAEYLQGSGSEKEAHSPSRSEEDEIGEVKAADEEQDEEVEEEEELEEEEEEESDEEDDDGLALEALDLEGY